MTPAEPFRCAVSYVDDGAVVVVAGEVDLATSPQLLNEASATFERPITSLGVDLGNATFIDSSGLGVLVVLERDARERGVTFTLVAVSPAVRRTLEVTGLAPGFGLSG